MIREAARADIPAILEVMRVHHINDDFPWPFNPVLLSMTVAHAIEAPDWLALIGPGAVFLGQYFDSPFGAGRIGVEHLVRTSNKDQFGQILTIYEDWARDCGCDRISLGCVKRPDVFARLYGRHGFTPAETVFSKTL